MKFYFNDYEYTVGEYDSESMLYTVTPHRMYGHLASYRSLTNAIIDINGVATPVVQYNGEYYIIRDLSFCFEGCVVMTSAPTIPTTVRNLSACFYDCRSFNQLITIPNSVTDMSYCFRKCTSFNQPVVIPSSVTDIRDCFSECSALSNDIYVLSNNVSFNSTTFPSNNKPIYLHTYNADLAYSSKLPENVIVGTPIYHMLNSRKLTPEENVTYGTTHGVRVDMLIDISNSGKLTGSTTTIYDMNDNEMDLDGYESLNGLLQCYSIVDVHNQVPTANLGISVTCIAPTQSYGIIGYPSTAESVRFYRNSSGGVDMAPRTNADMIYFNHKDSTDLGYTVKSALVYIISQYYPNYQYLNEINNRASTNKMQINVSDGNDTDIKHFITTADYIMATNTKTVQDIINDLYTLSQS